MQELIPVALGLNLGLALGFLRPSLRLPVGVVLACVLGALATVVTGEFRSSWGYLLTDVPLVALFAVAGLLLGRRVAPPAFR